MADARVREAWNHTSWITATIINFAGRIARRAVTPDEVNLLLAKPRASRGIHINGRNIGILREVYVPRPRNVKSKN